MAPTPPPKTYQPATLLTPPPPYQVLFKKKKKKKKALHVVATTDLRSSKMDPVVYQHLDQIYIDLMKTRNSININDYANIKEESCDHLNTFLKNI